MFSCQQALADRASGKACAGFCAGLHGRDQMHRTWLLPGAEGAENLVGDGAVKQPRIGRVLLTLWQKGN